MKRPNDLLTAKEAAAEKGVHVKSLYVAVRKGKIKHERRDGIILIRRKDLEAWTVWGHRPPRDG
jgi:helix-turn-helix protein